MDKEQIIQVINKRINEHKQSLNEVAELVKEQQEKAKKTRSPEDAMKLMAGKDRILFDKACLLLLEDLLKEINNE